MRNAQGAATRRRSGLLRPLLSRPHLLAGAAAGLAFYLAGAPWIRRVTTRSLIGWDIGAGLFIVLSLLWMREDDWTR